MLAKKAKNEIELHNRWTRASFLPLAGERRFDSSSSFFRPLRSSSQDDQRPRSDFGGDRRRSDSGGYRRRNDFGGGGGGHRRRNDFGGGGDRRLSEFGGGGGDRRRSDFGGDRRSSSSFRGRRDHQGGFRRWDNNDGKPRKWSSDRGGRRGDNQGDGSKSFRQDFRCTRVFVQGLPPDTTDHFRANSCGLQRCIHMGTTAMSELQ